MKVLVTGARGQLAQELVGVFEGRGAEVAAFGRDDLDITSLSGVRDAIEAVRPDVVINAAAYNDVDRAEEEWRQAFLVNGVAVRNLALAARARGAVLVHFGTDYVFPGSAVRPYTIGDAAAPIQRYGESKLLGERYLRDLMDRFYLVRVSWVFGPKGANSFPARVLSWAREREVLKIVTDQMSRPSYAPDLAEAVADLVDTGAFGVYHMTSSGEASRFDWAAFLLAASGWRGEVMPVTGEVFPTPARRPAYSVMDGFPLRETIGRELPDWRDATERYLHALGEAP